MKFLLHTCCGPCACACVPRLKEEGHEVTLFFSNSNIDTPEEFEKRLAAAQQLATAESVDLIVDAYDHASWLREVAVGFEAEPEKGARCARCFRFNLARTATFAEAHGFDGFTTSLTVSPHKPSAVIFAVGETFPGFVKMDFKKKNGFLLSTRRAEELNLYRQSYCGCEFAKMI